MLHRAIHRDPPHYAAQHELRSQQERASPYNKIVGVLPEMRRDTIALVNQAVAENRQTYVLVSNRSEGNAPLTIQALQGATE